MMTKKALPALVLIAAGIGAYGYRASRTETFAPEVRVVTVTRGDVVDTVVATGSIEAVTTVQVGSQVSGTIRSLYADYNSIVREGDVIMRLDPALFETQTEQARANLLRAEADVERFRVEVENAQVQLDRSASLAERDLISAADLEAAEAASRSAEARLKSGEAQVVQARASLNQSEVNLEHTVIRAPIDGIVISRLVDVGQTVAASLQAPELFVIAADLTKMRVIANIDESDVGRVRPGQKVVFTVDAYPDEEFEGAVSQIRLEPVVQQNVVTYATVVDAPNPDLKLKPGMTATITLEIVRRENVLKIPNAALRFRPTPELFAALDQPTPETVAPAPVTERPPPGGGRMRGARGPAARGPVRPNRPATAADAPIVPAVERGAATIDALFGPLAPATSTGRVWIMQDGGRLSPVAVRLGVTDGAATELIEAAGDGGRRLPAGAELVSRVSTPGDGSPQRNAGGGSPLIPQFGRGRPR